MKKEEHPTNPVHAFRQKLLDATANGKTISAESIEKVSKEIAKDWGGERYYYPKRDEQDPEKSQRDQRLFRDWRHGESIEYLMRKYTLAKPTVYAIINKMRAEQTT